jgi:hypothetical protein
MPRIATKYLAITQNEDVARWVRNLERGSPVTSEVAVRRLGKVSELLQLSPKQIVTQAQTNLKGFQDRLEDLVSQLEMDGKSPGYINNLVKIVRHWLRYNDVLLTRRIKITNSTSTPSIEGEMIPSQDDLAKLFRNSSSRLRVAEALMAFADLRPESIGNHNGNDGLKLSDLPELRIENDQILFDKIPTMVVVRAPLSKAKHKYFTFLPEEGTCYVKEYLEERVRRGEKLHKDSPLVAQERTEIAKKPFMLTRKVSHSIRKAMRKSGILKRPYVLRAYAETQFTIAESKGKISHPYLQFFAGHRGDIEARYSTHKGKLSSEMVEDMRESYRRSESFLSTNVQEMSGDTIKLEFKKQLLAVAGFEEEEIGKRDLTSITDEELHSMVRQKLLGVMEQNGARQRVVAATDIERYLSEGWEYVAAIPDEKAVIRIPF